MSSVKISVIIPAYNCAKTIAPVITAVLAQECSQKFELIVVDDGSTDGTAVSIKTFPQANYLYQPNAGPAAARNRGARAAQGEILFFTDSDCLPHNDWLAKMLVRLDDPQVAAVAGSYGIANPGSWLAAGIHAEIMYRHQKLMPAYPKAFGSYNVSIRRGIFEKVNGFDASYRYASGEDNDLSYKIGKAGYKIYFERHAFVDHYHTENLKRYLSEQYRHGFWRAKIYGRHPDMMKGDDYTFFKDIIEMPMAVLTLLSTGCWVGHIIPFKWAFWSIVVFTGFELFYALRMIPKPFQAVVFSTVMFLRAYARLAGFLTGMASFFPLIRTKKV